MASRKVVWLNKRQPKPPWQCVPFDPEWKLSKRQSYRYWNKIWDALPLWADQDSIKTIYAAAHALRQAGEDVHVDHIVPLKNPLVSGLHVHYNLRITSAQHNLSRSNNVWPDMPFNQGDLFEHSHASEEFELWHPTPKTGTECAAKIVAGSIGRSMGKTSALASLSNGTLFPISESLLLTALSVGRTTQ